MPYRIKEFREMNNMMQAELYKRANISQQILIDLKSDKELNSTIAT